MLNSMQLVDGIGELLYMFTEDLMAGCIHGGAVELVHGYAGGKTVSACLLRVPPSGFAGLLPPGVV